MRPASPLSNTANTGNAGSRSLLPVPVGGSGTTGRTAGDVVVRSPLDAAAACRNAIVAVQELHCFLQTWYRGEGSEPTSAALTRLYAALHKNLQLIDPDGVAFDRGGMLALIVPFRGCYPDLRIQVRACKAQEVNGLVLVTYIEEQFELGRRDVRRCSAVMVPDVDAPDGCMWLRIHETRVPPAGA
jgi:hypothetical protein